MSLAVVKIAKELDKALDRIEELEGELALERAMSKPSIVSYRGRFIEFRARGVWHWRHGKELPDGRIAYLERFDSVSAVTGKNFLLGYCSRRKLEAAVEAARYWKEEAQKARGKNGLGLIGLYGVLGAYFIKRGLI